MPEQQEPDVAVPVDYSPTTGAEAFATLMVHLGNETPLRWRAIGLAEAAERGTRLAKLLTDPGVAQNVASLEGTDLDPSAAVQPDIAKRLRDVSHALYYRASLKKGTPAEVSSNTRVPVALWDEVIRLRRDLIETLTFAFRGDAEVEAVLALVRPGGGYHDHAQDLSILADLAQKHADTLGRMVPGFFEAADVTRATHLATAMLDAIAETSDEARDDTDQRLWSLFFRTFKDGQECLDFIWRRDPAKLSQIPRLVAGRRSATQPGDSPATPEAPPEVEV